MTKKILKSFKLTINSTTYSE